MATSPSRLTRSLDLTCSFLTHCSPAGSLLLPESDYGLPQMEESHWFVNCQRSRAEEMLQGRTDGTFLIRPKPEEGTVHVLSIV